MRVEVKEQAEDSLPALGTKEEASRLLGQRDQERLLIAGEGGGTVLSSGCPLTEKLLEQKRHCRGGHREAGQQALETHPEDWEKHQGSQQLSK